MPPHIKENVMRELNLAEIEFVAGGKDDPKNPPATTPPNDGGNPNIGNGGFPGDDRSDVNDKMLSDAMKFCDQFPGGEYTLTESSKTNNKGAVNLKINGNEGGIGGSGSESSQSITVKCGGENN